MNISSDCSQDLSNRFLWHACGKASYPTCTSNMDLLLNVSRQNEKKKNEARLTKLWDKRHLDPNTVLEICHSFISECVHQKQLAVLSKNSSCRINYIPRGCCDFKHFIHLYYTYLQVRFSCFCLYPKHRILKTLYSFAHLIYRMMFHAVEWNKAVMNCKTYVNLFRVLVG